jgi:hypothetical protein
VQTIVGSRHETAVKRHVKDDKNLRSTFRKMNPHLACGRKRGDSGAAMVVPGPFSFKLRSRVTERTNESAS